MALRTTTWDPADHLKTPEAIAAYLDAICEDGDPALIAAGLGDIARSKGMSAVSKDAGVTREALYKALSENGDPRLSTVVGVFRALGLRLAAVPATHNAA
jgi:probable addiction module antidote protein